MNILPAFPTRNIPVVFSSDSNYLRNFSVALQSLIEHSSPKWNYDILLLASDVPQKYRRMLSEIIRGNANFSLRIVDVSSIFDIARSFFVDRHLTSAAYYRLFLPSLLPNYDKVAYLDIDVIINADIAELVQIDLGDDLLGGCLDPAVSGAVDAYFKSAVATLASQGLPDCSRYVNSGILLFNLKKMREEATEKKLVALASREALIFHDQDALNIVCQSRILLLPRKWNFTAHNDPEMYSAEEQSACAKMLSVGDFGVIHWPGPTKPWDSLVKPMAFLWWKYAAQSPFFMEILTAYFDKRIHRADGMNFRADDLAAVSARLALYPKIRRAYIRFKLMAKISFGERRRHYKAKCRAYKREIAVLRAFLKGKVDWRAVVNTPFDRFGEHS